MTEIPERLTNHGYKGPKLSVSQVARAMGHMGIQGYTGAKVTDPTIAERALYQRKKNGPSVEESEKYWAMLDPEFIETKMNQTMQAQTKTLFELAEENANLKIQVREQKATIDKQKALITKLQRDKLDGSL